MSRVEWVAKQYGVLLGEGTYKQFTTLEAANTELAYLRFRSVEAVLAEREIHTAVTETPWVEIGAAA